MKLIDVRSYLPDGVSLANTGEEEFNGKAAVTVKVEALEEITVPINKENIQFVNVPEGYVVTPETTGRIPVRFTGLQRDLDALDRNALGGTVDVSVWMTENEVTELQEGVVEMEVTFQMPAEIEQVNRVTIPVTIEKIDLE